MRKLVKATFAVVAIGMAQSAAAALVDDLLLAADDGQCIEIAAADMIRTQGPEQASTIVQAAMEALAQRELQQQALGCTGNIAGEAIAAGADPNDVLAATAAGLGDTATGAPSNLGGVGDGDSGIGNASSS